MSRSFIFDEASLCLMGYAFGVVSKKSLPNPRLQMFYPGSLSFRLEGTYLGLWSILTDFLCMVHGFR